MSNCAHSRTIEDATEGNTVCVLCGLVLGQVFLPTYSVNWCEKEDIDSYTFLADVCDRACIVNCIREESYARFMKLMKCPQHVFKEREVIAYALYETLIRHKNPHTPTEIAFLCNVNSNALWKIEKVLLSCDTPQPLDFLNRFCGKLNLNWRDNVEIAKLLKSFPDIGNIRSQCIVCVCIHIHVKNTRKKLKLKDICDVCLVSTANVHKIIRLIKTNHKSWLRSVFYK